MAEIVSRGVEALTGVDVGETKTDEQEEKEYQADLQEVRDALQKGTCGCMCPAKPEYSSKLQSALLSNKALWSSSWWRDYTFHVWNRHPLLSCFFVHPAHPYNRRERIAILITISALTMGPTFQLKLFVGNQRLAFIEILLFITLPVLCLQYLLEAFAVLDFQLEHGTGLGRVKMCSGFCDKVAKAVNALKTVSLATSLVLALIILCISYWIIHTQNYSLIDVMRPFLVSRLQAWVLWFPLDLFLCHCFISRRRSEMAELAQEAAQADGNGSA